MATKQSNVINNKDKKIKIRRYSRMMMNRNGARGTSASVEDSLILYMCLFLFNNSTLFQDMIFLNASFPRGNPYELLNSFDADSV